MKDLMRETNHIAVYAFRYALGRSTYAVSDVVKYLIKYWSSINPKMQTLIHREIREAIEREEIGMSMDKRVWEDILKLEVEP